MLDQIIQIAKQAGEITLSFYRRDLAVQHKQDLSPLTQADLQSNRYICRELKLLDPHIPIISEENRVPPYARRRKWRQFWLVDPLDGTKEFLKHNDEFTVNIALIVDRIPLLGVVYAPALGLLYWAQKNKGSWKLKANGPAKRICFRKPRTRSGWVALSSRSHMDQTPGNQRIASRIKKVIRVGSSLKFCYLAEGKAHVYAREAPTMEWDVAAGDCIFRYAARRGTNTSPLKYNKADLKNKGFVIGANP